MFNYKLTIQYDGGRYKGWQKLGNGEPTIQDKIEKVLTELFGTEIEIIGCSRTDAGVHALAQIANFKVDKKLTEEEVKSYLNHYLPQDISITEVSFVQENFHARYNAKGKTYLYKVWNKEYTNPFMRKYSMHVEKKLNIDEMRIAAGYFIGEHDFTAYYNAKSKKKSMVRRIFNITFEEDAGFLNIRINGDGFLYNMVRKMIGSLVEVGLGELEAKELPNIIASKDRKLTGRLADAGGLYLERIDYE